MNKYVIMHEHEYGTSAHIIATTTDLHALWLRCGGNEAAEVALATQCGIDFEPEKGEVLTVQKLDDARVVDLSDFDPDAYSTDEDTDVDPVQTLAAGLRTLKDNLRKT